MDDLRKAELRWSKTTLFKRRRRVRWWLLPLVSGLLAAAAAFGYGIAQGLFSL